MAYVCFTRWPLAGLDAASRLVELQQAALETQNMRFEAALANMSQGLAMFDAGQGLVMCNKLYAEMYGLTPEQLKPGTTVRQIFDYRLANGHYHVKDSETFVDTWTDAFGERSARIQELADGRIISVVRRQTPDGGRLVTHEDITERHRLNAKIERQNELLKQHEERLLAQNVQLDAALSNMAQGLAMFDDQLRLVVANDRYAELYRLAHDQIVPGTTLHQLLDRSIANGCMIGKSADDVVEFLQRCIAGQTCSQLVTSLQDGRMISVSIQPMADGGYVTTHQDVTEQKRAEARIAHMALHDALTDLPNRTLFRNRLDEALIGVRRGDGKLAVLMVDLDRFKQVNDTLGHAAGDALLKAVTERLRNCVRVTDTVARLGGDEFAVLAVSNDMPREAAAIGERIGQSIGAAFQIDGHCVRIGTSIGIAWAPDDGSDAAELLKKADVALYRAKREGRGTHCFFGPGGDQRVVHAA